MKTTLAVIGLLAILGAIEARRMWTSAQLTIAGSSSDAATL